MIIYISFQAVPPITDDDDGHLAYKLGDVIEHENHRCKDISTNFYSVHGCIEYVV